MSNPSGHGKGDKMKKELQADKDVTETAKASRLKQIEGRMDIGKQKMKTLDERDGDLYRSVRAVWLARTAAQSKEGQQQSKKKLKDEA